MDEYGPRIPELADYRRLLDVKLYSEVGKGQSWSMQGGSRPLTLDLIQSAYLRAEQAIVTPQQIIVHPRQYNAVVLVLSGVTYRRRDDDLLPTPRPTRRWWRR